MWNAQQWTCRSFKVPAFIHAKDDDRYFATNDFQHSKPLRHISSTIGQLKMEQEFVSSLNFEFENQFRIILHDIGFVENILVSGDQSMIAIECITREVILKMSGGQVQSGVELDQSGRSMFIPGSHRLLIYDERDVYEYNLQGDKIAWQDISQTKSVDVGRPQRNPQTTVNIFDLIEFVGIEDCRKYRELINGILEEESAAKDLILFRYRKKDNTLILMNTFSSFNSWIITINLTTGMKSVDRLTWSHDAVYVDDGYLYAWGYDECLRCYKFGDGEHRTQLLQNIKCQEKEGLICKIMINYNPNKIKHSPLRMKKEKLVDVWEEKDAEMIANVLAVDDVDDLLLLLENGDHIAILNQDGNLYMKRYKDNIKYFDNFATQFFDHENLWSDKQLILYENSFNNYSLNIYNPQTLELQITLPFQPQDHFLIEDMQWNLQHSQLIIKGDKDYCLVVTPDVTQYRPDSTLKRENQWNKGDISQYFLDVATNLEKDWIDLASKLNESGAIDVSHIQDIYKSNYDRASEFLERWSNVNGEVATKKRLIGALRAIKRKDIVEKIGSSNYSLVAYILKLWTDYEL
ncbi:uncharacterized protein TRIADDRAFT_62479 [Trichoplax adhaerens]|uniref:Death domain-containing protein n=1 Tax=Trichoplax adhaerens TaxID=10228 RepID=B3SDX5_TRIAD|nr:predicted protein [Trichoplax adhaerens]EDV19073.1 predicted protein [Trichoplax adhaerens]|eukprot:XP_002118444.1 predicted protein [Trichoplax adhaerens]